MALMDLNLDGVLTEETVRVPADGIVTLEHNLFKPGARVYYAGKELADGQDYVLHGVDERLYYQKNVTLFTSIKILNEFLFNKEIKVTYFACGDYINAAIWNEYPTAESLKQSLKGKVDNATFRAEVARLDQADADEKTARESADAQLAQDISGEAAMRAAEDSKLRDEIATEAAKRTAEDKKLDDKMAAEATKRESQDTYLAEEIEHESELRITGDNYLQGEIDAEKAARESADTSLQAQISSEVTTRTAEDKKLDDKIAAETSARTLADNNLQSQVTGLKTKFESFVPGLTYKVVTSLPTSGILSDVIYLVPTATQEEHQIYDEYLYINSKWELLGTTATTQAIIVDQALSSTSENPVQNKAVQQALSGKLDKTAAEFGGNSATATSLQYKGVNGWTTATDTPANWIKKGTCSWYITQTGQLNGQPTQYGVVLNLVTTSDVRQLFFCCSKGDGRIYQRGGMASAGWHANGWHKVIDTACLINSLTSTSTTDALAAAQGKALNEKFGSYLPLAGGVLTGDVKCHTTQNNSLIHFEAADQYGSVVIFGADGLTIISGGEAGKTLLDNNLLTRTAENVVLAADTDIIILTNLQNKDSRRQSAFRANGDFDLYSKINTGMETGTFLNGNQGNALINSKANAGAYVMLAKMNSNNGFFTIGTYQGKFLLQYTAKSKVDAGENGVTKSATLLDEAGNATFPGNITISGNLKVSGVFKGMVPNIVSFLSSAFFYQGEKILLFPLSYAGGHIITSSECRKNGITVEAGGELVSSSDSNIGKYIYIEFISSTLVKAENNGGYLWAYMYV